MAVSAPEQLSVTLSETTWLEGIVHVDSKNMGDGSKTLLITLANGHRYAIPVKGVTGRAIQRAVSPIEIP